MKPSTRLFLFLLVLAALLPGCTEEYIVNLDAVERVLVVEGLITDTEGPHKIRLSMSNKFQEANAPTPFQWAMLYIECSDGTITPLEESDKEPGTYLTPAAFTGSPNHSYTLHIETADGDTYRSEPQELPPPLAIDSLYWEKGNLMFYNRSNVSNNIYQIQIDGASIFIKASPVRGTKGYFRFISLMYAQYYIPLGDAAYKSCWVKWPVTDFMGPDTGTFILQEESSQQVGFLPLYNHNLSYMGLNDQEDSLETMQYHGAKVMINKIYTLNPVSHAFHMAKNEQLNNEGRFFDPIASQPEGNIRCVNDPGRKVLGLFEASAETVVTYKLVVKDLMNYIMDLEPIHSLESIPTQGCMLTAFPDLTKPEWWVD
ncbi:MAG: DUF4249 domain-containing protein [Bacteroidales bacterium]